MEKNVLVSKSRYGKLLRSVVEQYLREDISCGLSCCDLCSLKSKTIEECKEVYIPDEEFLEEQIDLISFCPCVKNFICLQSVMKMVQIKGLIVYNKMKELIEAGYSGFYYFANEHFRDTFVVIPYFKH